MLKVEIIRFVNGWVWEAKKKREIKEIIVKLYEIYFKLLVVFGGVWISIIFKVRYWNFYIIFLKIVVF